MQVTTADGHTLTFLQKNRETVTVYGSKAALDCFTNGVVLAGSETLDGSEEGSERSAGVVTHLCSDRPVEVPSDVSDEVLETTPGTVALWLSFEALNYL